MFHLSENDKKNGAENKAGAKEMISARSTTDIIFLIGIIFMWIAMSGVGGEAVQKGNVYRLIAPVNDQGQLCGIDSAVSGSKYLYYINKSGMGVCTSSCPTAAVTETADSFDLTNYYCLSVADALFPTDSTKSLYIKTYCQVDSKYSIAQNCLCNIKRKTKSIFRRCIFTDSSIASQYVDSDATSYIKTFMQDIMTARNVIFGFGFAVALVFSFLILYLLSLETLGWFVAWFCIVGCGGLMIGVVYLANKTCNTWKNEDPEVHTSEQIVALRAFSGIMMGISGLYLCLMLFMRKNINVAVKCVSMAAMSIEEMPFMVFAPILQVAAFIVFMIPYVIYSLYLASMGSWVTKYQTVSIQSVATTIPTGKTWVPDSGNNTGVKLWFLFFCLLWTMNFISAYGQMVIAMAVSKWYFTNPTNRVADISSRTLLSCYLTVLRYHLGTCAFGSLLIAIVQFIRAVVLYIQKHMSQTMQSNPAVKVAFCCVQCCLWCLECCMKFISKNAYIQTAIHGTSFMVSAKNAFFIICRNILRIGAVFTVSHLAIIAGKLFVTMLATATSYYYFTGAFSDELHDFVAPTILVMVRPCPPFSFPFAFRVFASSTPLSPLSPLSPLPLSLSPSLRSSPG